MASELVIICGTHAVSGTYVASSVSDTTFTVRRPHWWERWLVFPLKRAWVFLHGREEGHGTARFSEGLTMHDLYDPDTGEFEDPEELDDEDDAQPDAEGDDDLEGPDSDLGDDDEDDGDEDL